jgi:hypothetical protein
MAVKDRRDVYSIEITKEEAYRDLRPGSPLMAKWAKARVGKLKKQLQEVRTERLVFIGLEIVGIPPTQRQTAVMQLPEDKPLSHIFPKAALSIKKRLTFGLNVRTVNELLRHTYSELDGWFYKLKSGELLFSVLDLHGLKLNTLDTILTDPAIPEVINFIDALPDIFGLRHYDDRVNKLELALRRLHPSAWELIYYCLKDANRFHDGFGQHLAWFKATRAEIAQLEACAAQS